MTRKHLATWSNSRKQKRTILYLSRNDELFQTKMALHFFIFLRNCVYLFLSLNRNDRGIMLTCKEKRILFLSNFIPPFHVLSVWNLALRKHLTLSLNFLMAERKKGFHFSLFHTLFRNSFWSSSLCLNLMFYAGIMSYMKRWKRTRNDLVHVYLPRELWTNCFDVTTEFNNQPLPLSENTGRNKETKESRTSTTTQQLHREEGNRSLRWWWWRWRWRWRWR